jgi:sortase A
VPNRRPLIVLAALVLFATGFAGTTFVMKRADAKGDDNPSFVAPAASSTTAATVATTVPPTTARRAAPSTTTTTPLPQPEPPPPDPYAPVKLTQVGTISIPKIGLQHPIYEGITLTVINYGPGHWPGSAMPGQRGNTVFPGHRVTHSHPFLDLDQLVPGDQVIFRTAAGTFTYAVTSTRIVTPDAMWVIDPTPQPTMTLIACHPKHSARQRIIVTGKLVRSVRTSA